MTTYEKNCHREKGDCQLKKNVEKDFASYLFCDKVISFLCNEFDMKQ